MPKIILTTNSAKHFDLKSGNMRIGRFSGGEVSLRIKEPVNDGDVYVVGSTNAPAENLIELLLALDTVALDSAKTLTAIIPYFGYSRADRQKFFGEAVSARAVVKMLEAVGGKNFKVVTVDIHSKKVENFFTVPFFNIEISDIFRPKIDDLRGSFAVAPDQGAEKRVLDFAGKCGCTKVAILQKQRHEDGSIEIKSVAGTLEKRAVIIDDMIDSGETLGKGIAFLKNHGVEEVYILATHMVWSGGGYLKLAKLDIVKKIYTTNTIMPPTQIPGKIEVIDVANEIQKIINTPI